MSRQRPLSGGTATFGFWNRIAVIVVGILLVSWGGPAASAFWGSVGSGFGAAKADAVAQGARPATAVSGTSVTVTWAASTTTAGRPVKGYSVARYATATNGTGIAAAGTCAGTIAALSCVDSNVPTGTWYYAVTPLLSAWQGAESIRSAATALDATPPGAPVITAPAYVYSSNVNNVPVSGTAEPGSTVVLTVAGAGAQPLTQTLSTGSSGNWASPPLDMSAFSEGTISYSARATDAAGNTGPAGTAASTKDVTAPTVTAVQLINGGIADRLDKGDKVILTFSDALNTQLMCSAWAATGAQSLTSNSGQVTVSVDAVDILRVTSGACTIRLGSVFLGADYTGQSRSFSGQGNGGNASSLVWNGTDTLTITLGAGMAGTNTATSGDAFPTYTPASGLTDDAGNPLGTSSVPGVPSRF
ncbi:hypothetical protein ACLRGI_01360 [Paenarthrobacter nitroguajacolicus]|uniref:hypothetical protein n=1 Tax=Paenarthrobacter nitroguajacolicus TaxID=211146 RepID=UPI003AED5896